MKKIWLIARKDFGEAFRSRSTYVYIAVICVITFSYLRSYDSFVTALIEQKVSHQIIYEQSRLVLSGLFNILPVIDSMFVCSIFATYAVVVEKAKRNLESLMATPVSLAQIWMGKTLAVTLPSVLLGLAVSVIGYTLLNFISVMPNVGSFIFPEPLAIFTAIILVPILVFVIVSIVLYLQLVISNPRIANLVFFAIFFGLLFGLINLTSFGQTPNFSLIYLIVIIICGVLAYLLSRSLTEEKVILSSKG